jgi:hypothetical protein
MEVILKKSLGFVDIVIYDNAIFHSHILSKIPLTLSQVKEVYEFRLSVMGDKKALMLSTGADRYIVPTQDAIDYIESKDRTLSIKADAFVIKSFSQRLFIKTTTGLKKMATPISFFSTDSRAIEWLLSIKD